MWAAGATDQKERKEKYVGVSNVKVAHWPVFKIEVNNALQTRFGPSKCNPKLKMKTSLEVFNIIYPTTRTNKRWALSLQEVELDGWFLILQIILEMCII